MIIEGVRYEVNWRNFLRNWSITIPCLSPKEAKKVVKEEMSRLGYKVLIVELVEDNVRVLRIWRL